MDFERISMILELGCRDSLWRPVAACGSLWRIAVAPIYYHARSLGLAGWQDGVWQAVGMCSFTCFSWLSKNFLQIWHPQQK